MQDDTTRPNEPITRPAELLATAWATLGIQATRLVADEGGTLVPPAPLTETITSDAAFQAQAAQAGGAATTEGPAISLGSELGRGGMGVVYEGTQRSLNRSVAVKTAREDAGQVGVIGLLREAWVGGHLEHPNVVPVHDVVREQDGPLIVMKRIEGTSWADKLANARRAGATERDLESDLRVLVQLAHAVHFAHTRGFVHLDLKPGNVMIGAFGEIYLVDWGVAASLDPDRPPFVPYVGDLRAVIGTPGYMSPEQAVGNGAAIDARTDVYLLGAILHELLVDRPPHTGPSMVDALTRAYESVPPHFPQGVPDELASICRRAMARRPHDRYPTAEAFRVALEEYLVHADSHALAADSQRRVAELRQRFAAGDEDEGALQSLIGEARFGLTRALQLWPANTGARTALQELLVMVAEHALAQGRWQVAASLIAELPEPRADLAARAEAHERDQDAQAAELERFKHDADLTQAARTRTTMAWLGAAAWLITNAGLGLLGKAGVLEVGYPHLIGVAAAATVIWTLMVLSGRATLLANVINRQVVGAFSVAWPIATTFWISAAVMDVPFQAAVILIAQLMILTLATIAVTLDRAMLRIAAVTWVCATLLSLIPEWGLEGIGVGGSLTLIVIGRAWARTAQDA